MSSITKKGDHLQYPILRLEAQGGLVALASSLHRVEQPVVGVPRKAITTFSKGSRRRLLRKIARLKPTDAKFITLTYPADYPTPHDAKQHLRAFFERIRRRCPEVSALWRMEFQKRGAPHFHLICFDWPFLSYETLRSWWQEIIGVIDSVTVFVRIEKINSWRGVMAYAAKYLAKVETSPSVSAAQPPFFNDVTYLHAKTEISPQPGRFWGVFNAEYLPLAELVKAIFRQVTPVALKKIKLIWHELWEGVSIRDYRGVVLFSERSYELFLEACIEALADLPAQSGALA